jgi:hypothetical protein
VLPAILVEIVDGANAGKSARTDASGRYAIADVLPGSFTVVASALSYETVSQPATAGTTDLQVDFVLPRRPPVNFAGVWIGQFAIDHCTDMTPPAATPIPLCSMLPVTNLFEFTLAQTGTLVGGTYRVITAYIQCPCGGAYGTWAMSGTVDPNGELTLDGGGVIPASGLTMSAITLRLRIAGDARLTGTVSASISFAGVQRAEFTGAVTSATRQ